MADTLYFLAPPLPAVVLVWALCQPGWDYTVLVVLLGCFAGGHHLPGYFRAYGDPDLRARFWRRLAIVPIVLLASAYWFESRQWEGLRMALFLWSIWHTVMQLYGIFRIYDIKSGGATAWSAWCDRALLLLGILAIDLNHAGFAFQLDRFLTRLDSQPPIGWLIVARHAATAGAIAAALLQFASVLTRWISGRPISLPKLLMMASTFVFFLSAYQLTTNLLIIGVASELIHDIQYFVIAWITQSNLAKRRAASPWLKALFGPSIACVVLYLAVCALYGSLMTDIPREISPWPIVATLSSTILVASTLFHFYIDGFIWRIREAATRADLRIGASAAESNGAERAPSRRASDPAAWRHLLYLGLLVGGLAWLESRASPPSVPRAHGLAERWPTVSRAHADLGDALRRRGLWHEAADAYQRAMATDPRARADIGQTRAVLLAKLGRHDEAANTLRDALTRAPAHQKPAINAQLALVLLQTPGATSVAIDEATALARSAAAARDQQRPRYLETLAHALARQGANDEAAAALHEAIAECKQTSDAALAARLRQSLNALSPSTPAPP